MANVYTMLFSKVYPIYVQKAVKKGRSEAEVIELICWLSGYDAHSLTVQINKNVDFQTFFNEAPLINPNVTKITGVVCGIIVENIEDPLMKNIRYLDKLVDELAKGKTMEKILRN